MLNLTPSFRRLLKLIDLQKLVSRLFARLMKSWNWILLIILTILIKWASWYPDWVEKNYTYGVYPIIGKAQRLLFGWIPFSIGDLFYTFLILVLIYRTVLFCRLLIKRKLVRRHLTAALQQIIFLFLFVYVFFNLLWGLNYNRKGISSQLGIQLKPYSVTELDTLTRALQAQLNGFAANVSKDQRDSFNKKQTLFGQAADAYRQAASQYHFLQYKPSSVKPSLFSYAGNYLGFQGYYNPFSGEAQVNTTIPRFLEPFVTAHEIAHQLGYGKENEANFVAFLACKSYDSPVFKYSMYFDMYNYAIGELYRRDTGMAKSVQQQLHPQVVKDISDYRAFYKRHRNPLETFVMWGYGHYLKANNQPGGKQTYNEVVAWLIAYYRKFGVAAL
ncbi:conserved hypothetical protein [candidate division TM7 genomosp. GTL1]|nr:conserved hypothetical protein [candidate division TM7 genomosp. GTL1]